MSPHALACALEGVAPESHPAVATHSDTDDALLCTAKNTVEKDGLRLLGTGGNQERPSVNVGQPGGRLKPKSSLTLTYGSGAPPPEQEKKGGGAHGKQKKKRPREQGGELTKTRLQKKQRQS